MDAPTIAAFANVGGVAILGYWLIFGLPRLLADQNTSNQAILRNVIESYDKHTSAAAHSDERFAAALDRLTGTLGGFCRWTGGNRPPS